MGCFSGGVAVKRFFSGLLANRLLAGILVSGLLHVILFGVAMGIILWGEAHAVYRMDVDMNSAPLLTLKAKPTPLPETWILAQKAVATPPPKVQPTPTPEPEGAVAASREPSWVGGMIGEDDYPMAMRKEKKEGRVIAELLIDVTGSVRSVSILQGADPAFNAVVLEKLKDARFRPALDKSGQPMNCRVRLPIAFKLN